MSVGKEEIAALGQLRDRQVRIYGDACDVGVWETPAVKKTIRRALEGLRELEGGTARKWATGSSYTTRCGFEIDGDRVSGVQVCVSRCVTRDKRAFYCIDMQPTTWAAPQH